MNTTPSRMITLIGLLVFVACDPGYRYRPVGWGPSENGTWEYIHEDLRFAMLPPGGLIGSNWLTPEPEIENRGTEPITITGVTLLSKGVSFPGEIPPDHESSNRKISPGAVKRIPFHFEFDAPIREALAEKIVVTVRYRVGEGEVKEFDIPFERSR